MELKARILRIKNKVLKEIEEAAKESDTSSLFINTKILEETEMLIRRLDEMVYAIGSLEKEISSKFKAKGSSDTTVQKIVRPDIPGKGFSARAKGNLRRKAFIKSLNTRGIVLNQRGGSKYITKSGGVVGIASASELPQRPYKWFLGLPVEDYFSVVLLCENEKGEVLNFILPNDFLQTYRENFSVSKGHLKFNICQSGDNYHMIIPAAGNVSINKFSDNYEPLK
jgi:hypothetical protein